jgi:UDP-N-acetylmuramoyl-L-alanyl-D-glutamate--2,6-diaminopimelate ligase
MENYFEAKSRLFTGLQPGSHAIINLDDGAGARLVSMLPAGVKSHGYSLGGSAKNRAIHMGLRATGTTFVWETPSGSYEVSTPWVGSFNAANTLAAAVAARAMGLDTEKICHLLKTAPAVPGRMQPVPCDLGFTVLVDYAHTDDALRHVLSTLRPLCEGRLLVMAGCGGDRDRAKRPLMAKAAVDHADHAVFTSDNPRSEDPLAILREMEAGTTGSGSFEVIPDRAEAIARLIQGAGKGDVVVLAGKGHENTQEIKGEFKPFSDSENASKAIREREGRNA